MGPILQTWSGSNVGYDCRNTEGPVVGCTAQDTVVFYQDGNLLLLSRQDARQLHNILEAVKEEEETSIEYRFRDKAILNGEEVESCVVLKDYCDLGKCKMDAEGMMCVDGYTSGHNYDPDKTIEFGIMYTKFAVKISNGEQSVFIMGSRIISLPSVCSFDDAEFYLEQRYYNLEYEGQKGTVLRACRHYVNSVADEITKYGEPSSQLIIDNTSKGGHAPMKSFS